MGRDLGVVVTVMMEGYDYILGSKDVVFRGDEDMKGKIVSQSESMGVRFGFGGRGL